MDDLGVRRCRIVNRKSGDGEPFNGQYGRVARARSSDSWPAQCRQECWSARQRTRHRRTGLSSPARRRAAAQALDPDIDRHLPGGGGSGSLSVACQLARRDRAQRQGDAGAGRRRACQRRDAAGRRSPRHASGQQRNPAAHGRAWRHGQPLPAGHHRRQFQGRRRIDAGHAVAGQGARRTRLIGPAAVHVRRAGRRHGSRHRRP